jgi:hypothetical protein
MLSTVVAVGSTLVLTLLYSVLILPRPNGPARQTPWGASQIAG